MKNTYDVYHLQPLQVVGCIATAGIGWLVCSLLLYNNLWPMLIFFITVPFWLKAYKTYLCRKRKERLLASFIPAMEAFVVSLRAGYAAERAIRACSQDMQRLTGKDDPMAEELWYMDMQLSVSVPLETLFFDLGQRSGLEDIQNFARVFAAGKRTGGELDKILTSTVQHIRQKQETEKDIATEIAAKRMEHKIMCAVPPIMLLYLRLSSPEYVEIFYTSGIGRCVMTACLCVYFAAFMWGRKITDIQV